MRSGFEKTVADLLKKRKISFEYEPYKIKYVVEANYIPDFVLPGDVHVEVKGYFKPEDRRKLKAVKKSNPDLDIRIWFQRDNFLTKSKKKRYSDWARLNGFPFHIGEKFPKRWRFPT